MKTLYSLFGLAILLSACSNFEIVQNVDFPEEETEEEMSYPSNVIVFEDLEIGSQVGAMTVSDIEFYESDTSGVPSPYNSTITFVGEVELSGQFTHSSDEDPFFGDMVCMQAIQAGELFPVVEGDVRSERLCFDNQDLAQSLFATTGGDQGSATVVINQYKWIGLEGEVRNFANLARVLEIRSGDSAGFKVL